MRKVITSILAKNLYLEKNLLDLNQSQIRTYPDDACKRKPHENVPTVTKLQTSEHQEVTGACFIEDVHFSGRWNHKKNRMCWTGPERVTAAIPTDLQGYARNSAFPYQRPRKHPKGIDQVINLFYAKATMYFFLNCLFCFIFRLQNENDSLVGKYSVHAQQLQSEIINLPGTVEVSYNVCRVWLQNMPRLYDVKSAQEQTQNMLQTRMNCCWITRVSAVSLWQKLQYWTVADTNADTHN